MDIFNGFSRSLRYYCSYKTVESIDNVLRFLKPTVAIKTCTHIVIIGATESKLAIKIPISEIQAVSSKARVGSPDLEPYAKIFRNGIRLSLAMACNKRGALQRNKYTNELLTITSR